MNILLINPPAYNNIDYIRESRCMQSKDSWTALWPPITLAYLGAVLKPHNVRLVDCIAEKISFKQLSNIIKAHNPRFVVVNTAFPSIYGDMKVAKMAKELNSNTVTIAIGIFPTVLSKQSLIKFLEQEFLELHTGSAKE